MATQTKSKVAGIDIDQLRKAYPYLFLNVRRTQTVFNPNSGRQVFMLEYEDGSTRNISYANASDLPRLFEMLNDELNPRKYPREAWEFHH